MGQAGEVLLRKLADQAELTAALGPALERAGKFPLVDPEYRSGRVGTSGRRSV